MYGGGRASGSGATGWGVLRHFDAFPKQREEAKEFFQSTVAGGVITIVAVGLMALLFLSELGEGSLVVFGVGASGDLIGVLAKRPRRARSPTCPSGPCLVQGSTCMWSR